MILFEVIASLLWTRILLGVLPFGTFLSLHKWLARATTHRGRGPAPREFKKQEALKKIVRFNQAICRRIPLLGTCLVQALATQLICSRHGISSECTIGVRCRASDEGKEDFKAHAWLVSQDKAWIGDTGDLKKYSVIAVIRC